MSEHVGERFREFRKRSAVTQSQVAEVLALDTSAVSRIENGERHLSAFELGVLAQAFGWDPREILGMERARPKLALAARLRKSGSKPDHAFERMAALVEVDALLDDVGLQDAATGLLVQSFRPAPTGVDMAKREGRELAETVLAKSPLTTSTSDLIGFAEKSLGVDVVVADVLGDCDGAVAVGERVAIAIVDIAAMSGRQRFTLAHEIGHAIAGDVNEVYVDHGNQEPLVETRADSFAANLLMPADATRSILGSQPGPVELVEAMVSFGVSWTALRRRCDDLHIVLAENVQGATGRELFAAAGRLAEEARVSAPIPARIPARLDRRVRKAYSSALVGAGVVAMTYGISGDNLERVLESMQLDYEIPRPQERTVAR